MLPKESLGIVQHVREVSPALSMLHHVWTSIDKYIFADGRDWNLEASSATRPLRLLDIVGRVSMERPVVCIAIRPFWNVQRLEAIWTQLSGFFRTESKSDQREL